MRFTKCLYAQMTKQQFFPPKGLVLPPKSDPEYASTERGIKLAAAFEMLYHKNPPQEDELSCFFQANGHVCARDSGGGGEAGDSAHRVERIGGGGGNGREGRDTPRARLGLLFWGA